MKKENLIKRAEKLEELMKKEPLYGYPRKSPEIAKASVAIIKAICEQENITPYAAKYALKMATEIIENEAQYEIIS